MLAQSIFISRPHCLLTTDGGYIEYSEDTKPYRRIAAGCPAANWAGAKPTLFVFPYDWRLDNAENGRKLADYVGCIRQFHRGSKVDIVTHEGGIGCTQLYARIPWQRQ